jgi:hypothetical protein
MNLMHIGYLYATPSFAFTIAMMVIIRLKTARPIKRIMPMSTMIRINAMM